MVRLRHASQGTAFGKGSTLPWLLTLSSFLNFSNNGQVQASPLHEPFRRNDAVTYPGEHISWTACGNLTGHLMECSSVNVPMDQFDKANSGNKTFNVPIVRMRGNKATKDSKNILYNPGGPGTGGISTMYTIGSKLMSIVGEDINIISFDPRGVDSSTPSGSCYATQEIRNVFSTTPLDGLVSDAPFMGSWAQNFARTCSVNTGEYGKYINTPQVAADMNSILDAIGQDDMYFWGQSYGTVLGQTYATLFPNRSERVVIDGVVNQFQWYGSELPWMDYKDTKRVLWGFLDECIKAGETACPLSTLSKDPDELNRMVEEFGEKLKVDPMPVYIDDTNFGSVTYQCLWYAGVLPSLFSYQAYPLLAATLFNAMTGNATMAFKVFGGAAVYSSTSDSPSVNEAVYMYRLNDGMSGKQHWPQGNEAMIQTLEPLYEISPLLYVNNPTYWAKSQWAMPKTHNYVPRQGVQTAHPVLVMSTRWDPVCALESARTAQAAFEDSRLIVVDGYGHCTYTQDCMCANTYIRNYFKDGSMPKEDVTCEVEDGKYFPPPPPKAA